jgi:hypothetical protein
MPTTIFRKYFTIEKSMNLEATFFGSNSANTKHFYHSTKNRHKQGVAEIKCDSDQNQNNR